MKDNQGKKSNLDPMNQMIEDKYTAFGHQENLCNVLNKVLDLVSLSNI